MKIRLTCLLLNMLQIVLGSSSSSHILSGWTTLNNGISIPRVGFGTAGLGSDSRSLCLQAIEAGFRLVDSAHATEWYREDLVLQALRERSDVPVALVTKIHPKDFWSNQIMLEKIRRSLEHRKRNTINIILLHSPRCWNMDQMCRRGNWKSAWAFLSQLYLSGELPISAVGVSNFNEQELFEILQNTDDNVIKPMLVQNWMDPLHQDVATRKLCRRYGIAYMAYSLLGTQWIRNPVQQNPILTHPKILKIASRHKVSPSSVILSWGLQHDALIIPRSRNPVHIVENGEFILDANSQDLRVILSDEEVTVIDELQVDMD